jgi:hypothetical protein
LFGLLFVIVDQKFPCIGPTIGAVRARHSRPPHLHFACIGQGGRASHDV